jgi:MSHA biogenesis protein MshO
MQLTRARGFTLVELIIVMVITGILAGSMVVFFKPAVESYLAVNRRAGLTDMADGAMRKMIRDVKAAVPNSIRLVEKNCFEVIPSSDGGRFRAGPDTDWDATHSGNPSRWLDMTAEVGAFDVVTALRPATAVNDFVVIDNQNTDDVYTGLNRATISGIATAPNGKDTRITLSANQQFPIGYEGGRFQIVPANQQAVFYVCSNVNVVNGTGTGTLSRLSGYGFTANSPKACPSTAGAQVMATKVASCEFTYNPNEGATQQSGYIQVQITLQDNGEPVSLLYGAHVENAP